MDETIKYLQDNQRDLTEEEREYYNEQLFKNSEPLDINFYDLLEDNKKEKKKMDNKSSKAGLGFVDVLQLLFIALKILGKITWSWWWVLSPMWITLGLVLIILAVYAIFKK